MTDKKVTLALVVVAIIATMGVFFPQVSQQVRETVLGSNPGPDIYSYVNVHGPFSQGGGVNATSTSDTTETVRVVDMQDYNVLDLTPTVGNTTYTLPATTTFPLLQEAGATRSWVFRNATTTSGVTATIAAGTGIDLQEPDGQNVVIADTNFAWITCYRKATASGANGGDIVCLVDESIPAD